jgi:aspartate-semialdehyde dehydrogenase
MSALAILHPMNLVAKELRETLGRGMEGLGGHEVRLLTTVEAEIGALTEVGSAAAIVQRYEPGSLAGVAVAFLCGGIAANRPILAALPEEVTAVVLSPDAASGDGAPVVAGINSRPAGARVLLSPHPAVVALAHLLKPLAAAFPVHQAVATIVQPASLHDGAGIDELFEQTRQVVAMTPRRRGTVFGAQLAFNLLPGAGGEEAVRRIETQLAAVLADPGAASALSPAPSPTSAGPPPVAIQLLQGPIFHCLTLSLHVRCAGTPSAQAVRKAIAASPYVELAKDTRHLGPIDAAASDRVLLGAVHQDAEGYWLWAAMDNLTRGGALNALEIAAAVH